MYWRMILTRVVSTLHTLIYARINLLVVEAAFRFRRTLTRYCIVERLWGIDISIETENRLLNMTTRRRLFKLMAATPLAAKVAADNAVAVLSGVDTTGITSATPSVLPAVSVPAVGGMAWHEKLRLSSLHVKNFGLPSFLEEQYRESAKRVNSLDPDIANKKSWSMAFKVCCQRERNYQKMLESIDKQSNRKWKEKALEKVLGFSFPNVTHW
jgi:hypothetical protein